MKFTFAALSLAFCAGAASAAPVTYNIDPQHTYPSFAGDHMGGMSVWRGKFRSSSGTVIYDAVAHSGTVDITVDAASIDFGLEEVNEHVRGPAMFDVTKYPTAIYKGKFSKFNGDAPAEVDGELTLHGVTKPLKLTINSFMCKINPMKKKEVCGADASASFNRADFGLDFGIAFGFKMETQIAIQVEGIRAE